MDGMLNSYAHIGFGLHIVATPTSEMLKVSDHRRPNFVTALLKSSTLQGGVIQCSRAKLAAQAKFIKMSLRIAPGIHDPHLIMEGKADSGTSGDTEIWARHGCIIFVNTNRMLRSTVENLPDNEGPDY